MDISPAEAGSPDLVGFDPDWYTAEYPDVKILGMDPAEHYRWIGWRLGRKGAAEIQPDEISSAEIPPAEISVQEPARVPGPSILGVGSPISRIIDEDWYRAEYLSVENDQSSLEHYEQIGAALGYNPNPYFDVRWYLTKYPDVAAAGVNPVEHYMRFGATEGRNPSPKFNTRFYAMQMDQSDKLDGELFAHFVRYGIKEGKLPDPRAIRAELTNDALGADLAIKPTSITVGIVSYKQDKGELETLINSIDEALSRAGPNVTASIVIYDNGLTIEDGSLPRHVELMSNGKNEGFGRAHNEIMKRAFERGISVYVGVNPDGALHRDCLINLLRMNQRHFGQALIEATQFPEEHPKFYHPETLECDWISGACFLITREIWNDTKGFDENIFLYCEDVDLSWSARRHGYQTLTCPSALFYHDVSNRGYSETVWKEMLIAGRYLAHKWGNRPFRKKMEEELLAARFFGKRAGLPPLDNASRLVGGTEHANFSKMFSFSTTRW